MGDDANVLNELLDLKDKVLKATDDEKKEGRSDSTRERIKDIVIALRKIVVTSSLITKSKLGNTISSIRNDYAKASLETNNDKDKDIEKLCKELLLKWKSIMDAAKGDKKSDKKTPSSSSSDKKPPSSSSSSSSTVPAPVSLVKETSRSVSPLPSTNTKSVLSDSRIKIVNAIKEIFTSNNNTAKAAEVATSIEAAVHTLFPNDFKQYRNKVVSLNFNLKKNEKLRMQVFNGSISATVLVTLTVQELASDKLKEQRHHMKEDESSSKRLDWNEEHREELFGELGLDSTIKWEYDEDDYSDPGD